MEMTTAGKSGVKQGPTTDAQSSLLRLHKSNTASLLVIANTVEIKEKQYYPPVLSAMVVLMHELKEGAGGMWAVFF